LVEPAHDDRSWSGNDRFNDGGQIWAEELSLFDRNCIWV
jgi:hypothetical protein